MAKVDSNDPRQPSVQIADALRSAIQAGELTTGAKLPPIRALAEEYGVAYMTVQTALRLLRDDGLLSSQQGRGVFVADRDQGLAGSDALNDRIERLDADMQELRERVAHLEGRMSDT